MKKLRFTYTMSLTFKDEVREHFFSLRCVPKSEHNQKIYSLKFDVNPIEALNKTTDGFGNIMYVGHCNAPHKNFEYNVTGIAWVDRNSYIQDSINPIYKYTSKYTEFDKSMEELCLKAMPFKGTDLQRAMFLMDLLYENFKYKSGVTNIDTKAKEAMRLGMGVCQDYAHILIALCRKFNIPSRYVVGMMIGEGETHAWVEIYDNGYWYGIDPTHNKVVDDYYIKISNGRDYEDCIIDKGIFKGFTTQNQEIYVNVEEYGG